jgi:hypothetical protein
MKYKKGILFLLIILWISLAGISVFYNSLKTISEIRVWVSLSNSQKLQKIFGPSYEFSIFIDANTSRNSNILFYSNEGMPYFYARYYLYPHRLYWYQNGVEYVMSRYPKQFDYVAFYNMNAPIQGYEKIATFSARKSNAFGSLYKRK